jgi:PAS domain S-box-containing protein
MKEKTQKVCEKKNKGERGNFSELSELYEFIIENTTDVIFQVELPSGKITYMNPSSLRIAGYNPEEMIGKSWTNYVPKKELPRYFSKIKELLAGKKINDFETYVIHKDTHLVPVEFSGYFVRRGNKGYIHGIMRDVTERKRMEEALRKAYSELEQKVKERTAELKRVNEELKKDIIRRKKAEEKIKQQNIELKKLDELKSMFFNITSHELRTPISSIKGYVQMLLKGSFGDINEEQREGLEVTLRNVDRLNKLIQDILDLSRLESGTMKFFPEKKEVETIIKQTVETMQSVALERKIKINLEIQNKIPPLCVDGHRIEQAMINILDNAIKFSPEESIVNIKARREKNNVLFEIQDFGIGIPKEKQEKVFDLFYQIHSNINREFRGAGLGLSIARGIIIAHGGKIWVESEKGEGSTFKFTLPVVPIKHTKERFKDVFFTRK